MGRMIRVLLALFFVAGVLALGFQGDAWASRLAAGIQPSMSGSASLTKQAVTLGDCAGGLVTIKSAPPGVTYRTYLATEAELPKPLPGTTVTCALKLQAFTSTNLGSDALICWPILTTPVGSAYYYDGSAWVKALAQTIDNQVCVDYVPNGAPNPVFITLFSSEPTGPQIPVTGAPAPLLAPRLAGTVVTTPLQIPVTGQTSALGNCTLVFSAVESPAAGVNYTVDFVPETELPTSFPGMLVSCPVKVEAVSSTALGAKTLVCWPLLPEQAGFAYYYDGSQWVKTTNSRTQDDQVCADVVAATAPNPAFVAVFDR